MKLYSGWYGSKDYGFLCFVAAVVGYSCFITEHAFASSHLVIPDGVSQETFFIRFIDTEKMQTAKDILVGRERAKVRINGKSFRFVIVAGQERELN